MWFSSKFVFVTVASSTIVQTIFHLTFTIFGYSLYHCEATLNYDNIFLYLTYLYQHKCGHISIQENSTLFWTFLDENQKQSLKNIVEELLDNAIFAEAVPALTRIYYYFFIFFVCDGLWILSALILLVGVCFRVKGPTVLYFNTTWILVTIFILLTDVATTAHFLLDLPITNDFDKWLQFVGIQNPTEFHRFNETLPYLSIIPTLTISLLTSRFIVIWFVNLFLLISVYKRTKCVFNEKILNNVPQIPDYIINNSRFPDLDISEVRIQSWKQFYGAIETTSSSSSIASSEFHQQNNKDLNSNNETEDCLEEPGGFSADFRPSIISRSTNFYYPFGDVAEGVDTENNPMVELRSQLPWSYFPATDKAKEKSKSLEWKSPAQPGLTGGTKF